MQFSHSVRRTAATFAAFAVVSGAALVAAPSVALAVDTTAERGVVVNEIVYDDVVPDLADSIELYNSSSAAVDISGWSVLDDKRDERGTLPAATTLAPGAFLVLTKDATPLGFPFGLGKGDAVVLLDAADQIVDEYAYEATAPFADWSRCADGGEWAHATEVTLGMPNNCTPIAPPETPGAVLLNEIDSGPADWVELINPGTEALDLSGYELRDNSDDHNWFFGAGSSIDAGERLVVDAFSVGADAAGAPLEFQAAIGIGSADSVRLFDAAGTMLDNYSWNGHPSIDGSEAAASWARCPDAIGDFALARVTPGPANDCVLPSVAINEVESNGDATDWVEVINTGSTTVDLSAWTLMDSDPIGHAADVVPVASGTMLAVGERFIFDQGVHFDFGLGGGDVATVRDAAGATVAEYSWSDHASITWARCPEGAGDFVDASVSTKGAANECGTGGGDGGNGDGGGDGEPAAAVWPGPADVTVVDEAPMFLGDASGLETQETANGTVLWAVDNGTGTFWKLDAHADGSVDFADGWEDGKRARYQRDADAPTKAGPDTEGITVDAAGNLYFAAERDNSNKGVNENTVLAIDADAAGPDVVATQEWDLTASLPQVAANTGLEAVEWVSDADLAGLLVDANTNELYDPADYPTHGDGLFFVAVEDDGVIYAYALGSDGSIHQIASIDPDLGGVMSLDYDSVLGEMWALCDNGCEGEAARIALTGGEPTVQYFARPASMPNLNNEGFATAPASLSTAASTGEADAATRPVWWFADGERPGALRTGTVPAVAVTDPTDPTDPSDPSAAPAPIDESQLTGANRASATDGLADTGADVTSALSIAGLLVLFGLGAVAATIRRRARLTGE